MKLFTTLKLGMTLAGVLAFSVNPIHADSSISFAGQVQAHGLTDIPWVYGSTMWGGIQTINDTGTAFVGFSSLSGLNPGLISMTSGGLELTSYLSPGPSSAGYEIYTSNGSVPLNLFYNGTLLASGTLFSIRVDVGNSNDGNAIGTGYGSFTAAGSNPAFFNELMSLSGNTGMVRFDTSAFAPVNNLGLFNTSTIMTVVPGPATAGLLVLSCLGLYRRRRDC